MKRFVFIASLCLFVLVGCSPAAGCNGVSSSAPQYQILFIGNSYTYANDLPGVFASLACSGGHPIATGMSAQGGWTLGQHDTSAQTIDLLKQRQWDLVILQEQSEIPAMASERAQVMYPAARSLVAKIRETGAQPILFLTWGHRDGLPSAGLQTYFDMQAQLDAGYQGIAKELYIRIAPVGDAWQKARVQPEPLDLWQEDGSHPNAEGTYLAACVFYATIFQETPMGLPDWDSLPEETAHTLQTLAAETVLKNK